ncbi:hypothetical protein [Streptomyces sp. NPDC003480]
MVILPAVGELGAAARIAKGVEGAVEESRTIWGAVKATQPNYPVSARPKSFELSADEANVWAHGNATEHIAEYLSGMAKQGSTKARIDLATRAQLESLRAAVSEAAKGGIPFNKVVVAGGWELKFSAPRSEGQLPRIDSRPTPRTIGDPPDPSN